MLISGDSGVMHMAYAMGTQTLALFGPGNYNKWAFKSDDHVIISKNMDCSPCSVFGHTPSCPENMKCMDMISVDEVYKEALKMLKGKNTCP